MEAFRNKGGTTTFSSLSGMRERLFCVEMRDTSAVNQRRCATKYPSDRCCFRIFLIFETFSGKSTETKANAYASTELFGRFAHDSPHLYSGIRLEKWANE